MYNIPLILLLLYSSTQPYNANLLTTVDSLQAEIAKNPEDSTLHHKLGLAYCALDQYENAIEAFNTVLSLDNQYYGAARKLAHVYGYQGDYHQMLRICEQYAKKTKEAYFSHELGMASAMLGDRLAAIEYYQNGLKVRPYNMRYEFEVELAILFRQVENEDETNIRLEHALEDLAKTLRQRHFKVNDELIASYKALYLFRLAYFRKADSIIERMVKDGKAEHIDLYNQAVFKLAAGDSSGLACLRNVSEENTTSLVHTIYQALIALKVDSVHHAEVILKKDTTALRNSGMAKGLLAWTLERIGKDAEAKKYWFMCYGKLPLGTDVASMRAFMDRFIRYVKEQP